MSEKQGFPALIEKHRGEIVKALPRHIDATRMERMCMSSFHKNPKLKECNAISVMAAVIQACQLGLEPDILGKCFLVPYYDNTKKEYLCQLIPGWKGLVDLTIQAGNANVWTGAVFKGDIYDFTLGDRPFIMHKPGDDCDTAPLTHVYAVGRLKGSEYPIIELWSVKRVENHRDRYNKMGEKHYSYKNFEMYARKVVLLQVLKYLPASSEVAKAIELNDQAEMGEQRLNIDGTYETVPANQSRQEREIPVLSDEAFQKKVPMWKKAVQNGQTPSNLIKIIENRDMLTEDQHLTIHSWKAEAE